MKLLLIEDEEKVVEFLCKGLEEEGYQAEAALDGRKGLEALETTTYDLILLDLMLPEIPGLEVLKRMREKGIDTPVLIITAKDSKEDVIRGLDTGSDDYLTKPFSFDELLARIRAILRRSSKPVQNALQYRDITLNPYTRRLSSGQKEIELTEKEFLIMEYMLRHAEKPLSRQEIADYVWQNTNDTSNIVDVYVNFLRKKTEPILKKRYIHTLRGTGYILKEEDETT
jgi:DNA-binding response OmpR family regulator